MAPPDKVRQRLRVSPLSFNEKANLAILIEYFQRLINGFSDFHNACDELIYFILGRLPVFMMIT